MGIKCADDLYNCPISGTGARPKIQDLDTWKTVYGDPTRYHNNNCMTTTNTGKIHHHDHRHWLCKSLADFCMSLIDTRFLNRWWFLLCEMIPQIWVWLGSVCSSANEIELKNDTFKRYLFSRLRRFFLRSETWVGNHVETVGYGWIWMDREVS